MDKNNKKDKSGSRESVLGVTVISVGCVILSVCFLLFYRLNIALFWAVLGYALSSLVVRSHNQNGITFYKIIKLSNIIVGVFSLCLIGYSFTMNEPVDEKTQLTVSSVSYLQNSVRYQSLSNT